jgi:hypothetical protein
MPTPDKTTAQSIVALSDIVSELAHDHQERIERLDAYGDELAERSEKLLEYVRRLRQDLTALESAIREAFLDLAAMVAAEQIKTAGGELVEDKAKALAEPQNFKAIMGGAGKANGTSGS